MEALSSLAGMEVPIMWSDSIKWFNVSVSSPSLELYAPPTEDASSFCKIGDPPTYFICIKLGLTFPNMYKVA
nr:hypothetical protein [Tanacetum cinerariifolium]